MTFLLNELIEKPLLDRIPSLAAVTPDLVSAVLLEAAKLAENVLAPLNATGDTEGCRFVNGKVITPAGWIEAYQQFCDNGWMGLALPEATGGQGLPKFIAMAVNEMWLSANMAFVMFHALNQGGSEILIHLGDTEQKSRYLEKLATGEWTVAMALTEPHAGSDLGTTTTKAIPQAGGSYLIQGQKTFITYGEHDLTDNVIHLVLARVEGAPVGSRGLSLFAVPKVRINDDGSLGGSNDVSCVSIEHKLGLNGSPTCSMSYGDNKACKGELIGEEGKGLAGMFILMNEARLSTGLQGVALGELGYQKALHYALERVQGNEAVSGKKQVVIAEHPDVKRMLLSIKAQVMAMRALAYLIASRIDQADACDDIERKQSLSASVALLTPIFKAFSTESGNLMAGTTIQIFGGMGFVEETGVAQLVRDARITTIYEGTTGIQAKDLLFRKIVTDKGRAAQALIDEVMAVATELADKPGLGAMGQSLRTASTCVAELVADVVKHMSDQDEQTRMHSGAVPLLEAMGIFCGSWQMARLAIVAQSYVDRSMDEAYHGNLVALANFYFAHFTPKIQALKQTFDHASQGLQDFHFH
jgi:alkylation response protein AidB-like acyl-CoA dehydrogenase